MVNTYFVKGNINEKPKLNWDGDREIIDSGWFSTSRALELLFWETEKRSVKFLK